MRIIDVDPRTLILSKSDSRRTAAPALSDAALKANIGALGLLQPPLARQTPEGLKILAGRRRVRTSIALGDATIPVLLYEGTASDDQIISLSENVQRQNLNPVDQWRGIEACISEQWTEDAIALAMGSPIRTIRKLRLLAKVHKPMLDHMATGSMPKERDLRTIAAASIQAQTAAWKLHKPCKDKPDVYWHIVADILRQTAFAASVAKFGPAEEAAFGIVWQEDLFAPADEDSRHTTQRDLFLKAQTAWVTAHHPDAVLLESDSYGHAALPKGAIKRYGPPQDGDTIAYHVSPRNGEIEMIVFFLKQRPTADGAEEGPAPPRIRPAISQTGEALIGAMRTTALRQAIATAPLPDEMLIGLLLLTLSADNVNIVGPSLYQRRQLASQLIEGGALTTDRTVLEAAARGLLTTILSCERNATNSGLAARICGDTIGADQCLPNMATPEFLACLSRTALERTASELTVIPHPRVRDTRAAIVEQVGDGRFLHPHARFQLTREELAAVAAGWRPKDSAGADDDPAPDDAGPGELDDPDQPFDGQDDERFDTAA